MRTPSGPGRQLANAASTSRAPSRRARQRREGSVRTDKTRTLRIPARYGLGQICGAETKPARFDSGRWVDPPEGWVDWVWLIGYKRGGCAKEMKRAELALNEERRHRVVCFHCYKSPEQEAKSQQIVGQSLLSCLQYPVPYLSRLQRIYPSQHSKLRWSMMLGRSLS